MSNFAARAWWAERVESGKSNDVAKVKNGVDDIVVVLDENDRSMILKALGRQFEAQKAGRYAAVHAAARIMKAASR